MPLIKDHSISIGFNTANSQAFFDMLIMYDDYIRDYFFGLRHAIAGDQMDDAKEVSILRNCDTYGYAANMLFNNFSDDCHLVDDITKVREISNLRYVTVLNPELGKYILKKFPDLEVQLSVRFFDWGRFKNPIARLRELRDCGISVINISGSMSYRDIEFMNEVHALGMKLKFITNEGCIIRKDLNYSNMPGFKDKMCRVNPFSTCACKLECVNLYHEYPWMQIASNLLYKESLRYFPEIDIYKISGRHRDIEYMTRHLEYWTNDEPTQYLYGCYERIDVSKKYDVFLDYVDFKCTKCPGDCWSCQKCKYFYEEFRH